MMTIEQLDAVPVGGKVIFCNSVPLERTSDNEWAVRGGRASHGFMTGTPLVLEHSEPMPLTEPQTWQDVGGCENCEYRLALQRIVLMYEPWTSARSLAEHVLTGGTVEGWQES